jgi:hypothetical protein
MEQDESKLKTLAFFEEIQKYYESKVEITEGLCTSNGEFSAENTTWNLFEFYLVRSAYRNNGARFMMEGKGIYYELDAHAIVSLHQSGRNRFEFIEQLSETVFRITKLRFHYKY